MHGPSDAWPRDPLPAPARRSAPYFSSAQLETLVGKIRAYDYYEGGTREDEDEGGGRDED